MICSEAFVFIHMHRSGGQMLNKVILENIPGSTEIGYHYPASEIPENFKHLPVVAFVRNPWDWYVSWYAVNFRRSRPTPLFSILSHGQQLGFTATIHNLIMLGDGSDNSGQYLSAYRDFLPDSYDESRSTGLTKHCLDDLSTSNLGYYSWLVKHMLGTYSSSPFIGKFEHLHTDFLHAVNSFSLDSREAISNAISKVGKKNSSSHNHYSNYYSADLAKLVGNRDAVFCQQYDYQYELVRVKNEDPIDIENTHPYKKMKGTAANFLHIGSVANIEKLATKIDAIPDDIWNMSTREKKYDAHRRTKSVKLVHDDLSHTSPKEMPWYPLLKEALASTLDQINTFYGGNGSFVRLLLAKLLPGGTIPTHVDRGYSLIFCNRVHVPLKTNESVTFSVGGEKKNMRLGEIWEVNNTNAHSVINHSEQDRIHLIADWTPNSELLKEKIPNRELYERSASNVSIEKTLDLNPQISRNSLCPCGSALKFKHCHGKLNP